MGIMPITSMRVSTMMQSNLLLAQSRANNKSVFDSQQQLATGLKMLVPSDDPGGAAQALRLSDAMDRYTQLQRNASFADNFSAATETALTELRDVLNQANSLASENVGSLVSADERASAATVLDGLISQVLNISNRQQQGMYLFSGQQSDRPPFVEELGGVLYQGDTKDVNVDIDGSTPLTINLRGDQVFGGLSAEVQGLPMQPRVDNTTYVSDLAGANNKGVSLGSFVIAGDSGSFTVDISGAHTVSDIVSSINNAAGEAGSAITADLSAYGITLSSGGETFSVTEQGGGTTAKDLGILRSTASSDDLEGSSLQPKVTLTTSLAWLNGGDGVDLTSGLQLSNGGQTTTLDLSAATTVQDVLNALNGTNMGVLAEINSAGTGINVLSRLSGCELHIGENGGTTATDLGIRSFRTDTKLVSLNDGQGVGSVDGADFQVTAKDGTTIQVDVADCVTIQDVISRINSAATAAGIDLAADLAGTGNGIRLTDNTGGSGALTVTTLNMSTAATDLGIVGSSSGTELTGTDVSPVRSNGIFTVLSDLHTALLNSDTTAISNLGDKLGGLLDKLTGNQGQAAAIGKTIRSQSDQLDTDTLAAKTMLSDIKDVDMTEAITKFSQAQTILQATLQTGASISKLSLLDFLG